MCLRYEHFCHLEHDYLVRALSCAISLLQYILMIFETLIILTNWGSMAPKEPPLDLPLLTGILCNKL